jgi:N6-adenosine-specific RNA methylase IME4/DNA modification methylase
MNRIDPTLIDHIKCCDCVEGMRTLPDDCIDMTLTSPPYGKMRDYGGQAFTHDKFQSIARELYRITKPGGTVVWVVRDQIVRRKGATGDSARQWLYFQEVGFSLHDMIPMVRIGQRWPGRNRYTNSLEYALVVSKGSPEYVDLIRDRENRHAGKLKEFKRRAENGDTQVAGKPQPINRQGVRGPVWSYKVGLNSTTKDNDALSIHPALMPEQMAHDHIVSWSRPPELVFDPMAGAGTTCKMALLNNRHYIGFEIHPPYHVEALRRLKSAQKRYCEHLDDWLVSPSLDNRLRNFDIIYADPPWPYKPWSVHPKGWSVDRHYHTLSMEEIKSLPVGRLAANDSVLFLWTTGPFLRHAQEVVEAWGFQHKTIGFTWVKTNARDGRLRMGMGYHTRANTELCLLAIKGRGLERVQKNIQQVVVAPVGRHSEKPDEVRHRIELLYGPQRRIELFARRQTPGWDALGDGIDGQDIRKVLIGA